MRKQSAHKPTSNSPNLRRKSLHSDNRNSHSSLRRSPLHPVWKRSLSNSRLSLLQFSTRSATLNKSLSLSVTINSLTPTRLTTALRLPNTSLRINCGTSALSRAHAATTGSASTGMSRTSTTNTTLCSTAMARWSLLTSSSPTTLYTLPTKV